MSEAAAMGAIAGACLAFVGVMLWPSFADLWSTVTGRKASEGKPQAPPAREIPLPGPPFPATLRMGPSTEFVARVRGSSPDAALLARIEGAACEVREGVMTVRVARALAEEEIPRFIALCYAVAERLS